MYDYGIIGGGPAGYTVAIALAKNGNKVLLFEKDEIGGTCLNRGCIPTKTLLHYSELFKQLTTLQETGFNIEFKSFDFTKIAERKDKVIEKIRKNLELAIKNSGVEIIKQKAEIKNKNTILADKEYSVKEIIIATGAKPREIKGFESDGEFILTSDDILKLTQLPKSVLIIGSGAIGIEWARIFSNFGVEVTIVEKAEHLIPTADIDISKRIERIFKQNKITYHLNDSIEKIENKSVTLLSGKTINPDIILSAIGRTPLDVAGSDLTMLGDASNEIQLAHYAIHQGLSYATNKKTTLNKNKIPSVIYGQPEIAWVGLREQDCDDTYKKISLPITALGKSWCDDSTEGFIKIIAKDNKICGAHIICKEASALIHQVLIAMQHNISIEELKSTCFAHPTYSEGIFETICRL